MNWHNISIRQFITHNSSSVLLSLGFVQKEEHRAGSCRDSSRHTVGASRVPAVKFRQDRTPHFKLPQSPQLEVLTANFLGFGFKSRNDDCSSLIFLTFQTVSEIIENSPK